jgi:hypothetical protein
MSSLETKLAKLEAALQDSELDLEHLSFLDKSHSTSKDTLQPDDLNPTCEPVVVQIRDESLTDGPNTPTGVLENLQPVIFNDVDLMRLPGQTPKELGTALANSRAALSPTRSSLATQAINSRYPAFSSREAARQAFNQVGLDYDPDHSAHSRRST